MIPISARWNTIKKGRMSSEKGKESSISEIEKKRRSGYARIIAFLQGPTLLLVIFGIFSAFFLLIIQIGHFTLIDLFIREREDLLPDLPSTSTISLFPA